MQDIKRDGNTTLMLGGVAETFRDQIWAIVEKWMQRLALEEGENSWRLIPETQLVDNLPTLLRGVSKVIGDPARIADFEPEGVIYQEAARFGANRRDSNYKLSDLLRELEILREIVWEFCRKSVMPLEFFDLEGRINRPFDKMVSTIIDSYVNAYTAELKYIARRDKLSNFLNYESFKEEINREFARSRRYRHPFSLIMLDIDDYRDYCQSFGNEAGEELLQEISATIMRIIRTVDIPSKYGYDEFAIILPETSKKQARKVAERIRRAVKLEMRHSAEVRRYLKTPVTVSIGISSYPKDAETVDEIISLADETLYAAKKAGKDIVVWK
ncbi:MAG: diguanylate cyclase [Firmicutes bacterium]|nr:diguanylate cyclase [Bacillota bacterium]